MAKTTRRKPRGGQKVLSGGRKRVLVVLFIPSVERDGTTAIDQQSWVDASLEMLGRVFGGATAYPKAKGVWRDDEQGGGSFWTSRWSSTATRRPLTSRTTATSRRSELSAVRWAARRTRGKSVSSLA